MYDAEMKNRLGFCKLEVMCDLMKLLFAKPNELETEFTTFNQTLEKEFLKRSLTPQEQLNLLEGLRAWTVSDEMTNERSKAIEYLVEMEYIVD